MGRLIHVLVFLMNIEDCDQDRENNPATQSRGPLDVQPAGMKTGKGKTGRTARLNTDTGRQERFSNSERR
jgi:hypothetical protein